MQRSELIAALEAATGPDREIDAAIARALNLAGTYTADLQGWDDVGHAIYKPGPQHYTASIDAALTLVPPAEGWPDGHADFTLDFQSGGCVCDFTCWARDGEDSSMGSPLYVRAPTPALAICIAALKARP